MYMYTLTLKELFSSFHLPVHFGPFTFPSILFPSPSRPFSSLQMVTTPAYNLHLGPLDSDRMTQHKSRGSVTSFISPFTHENHMRFVQTLLAENKSLPASHGSGAQHVLPTVQAFGSPWRPCLAIDWTGDHFTISGCWFTDIWIWAIHHLVQTVN